MLFCMYHECENNENHEIGTSENRKPGVCKILENGKDLLIVPRWVSLNVVELHKYLELFPTCAMVNLPTLEESLP